MVVMVPAQSKIALPGASNARTYASSSHADMDPSCTSINVCHAAIEHALSPSLSNKENASLNSTICSSVSWSAIAAVWLCGGAVALVSVHTWRTYALAHGSVSAHVPSLSQAPSNQKKEWGVFLAAWGITPKTTGAQAASAGSIPPEFGPVYFSGRGHGVRTPGGRWGRLPVGTAREVGCFRGSRAGGTTSAWQGIRRCGCLLWDFPTPSREFLRPLGCGRLPGSHQPSQPP